MTKKECMWCGDPDCDGECQRMMEESDYNLFKYEEVNENE